MTKTQLRTYAERIAEAPGTFLGVPVPADVAAVWKTWRGAAYRRQAAWSANTFDVPDQRFGVLPPPGMCGECLEERRQWRDMYFDDRSGNRWPGTPGSPFTIIDSNLGRELAWRRTEWDVKCIEMMQRAEDWCLQGYPFRRHVPRTCLVHAVSPAYCPCGWPCLAA